MKVLFVISGNAPAPFIQSQGESLEVAGISVSYFPVEGRGIRGYLSSVGKLRKRAADERYDILHAHYSFCGWVAVLAMTGLPVVLSLMGDDALGTPNAKGVPTIKSRVMTLFSRLIQPFVSAIISKSPNLEATVYRKSISHLIPNGVRLEQFEFEPNGYRSELGLSTEKQYVLFLGDPNDTNKNSKLVKDALAELDRSDVGLLTPYPVPHDDVAMYLNSVDVFTLCSFSEGSPNVVKEAMACNCCIVVTDVGDTLAVVEGTAGCFVASYDPKDFAAKLEAALDYAKTKRFTRGRERILELGMDAPAIADRVIEVYQHVHNPSERVEMRVES
ncbi:glycosyltransferase [Planctomycetota bacterium]